MEQITTQPNTYAPFTYEEFQIIKAEMDAIGLYLPSDAGAQRKIWDNCTSLRGRAENQPCSCKSSGGLWARCIDDIKQFIKDRS
jgi:hypothetical protein